jgi:TFIIF-interacting CTD phosphatase-like protein
MERPLLILDLDETLIYGTVEPLPIKHDFKCGGFFIHKRPFVDQFISSVAQLYDLAVWTSSTMDYARCIADVLFDGVDLKFLWARDRCIRRFDSELQEHYWVKDLNKVKRIGFALERILVVDDTPEKLERNYGSLIVVRAFEGDADDRELLNLKDYVAGLVGEPDFRVMEKRMWRQ